MKLSESAANIQFVADLFCFRNKTAIMIVDSMTHEEVYQELERDREAMTLWWHHKKLELRRRILKAQKFPINLWFEYTSPRKVRYFIQSRFFDKRMKVFLTGIVAVRQTSDGLAAYTNWLAHQKAIFPMVLLPHMFKQYAARHGVKETGIDLMKTYFSRNPHGQDTTDHRVVGKSVRYNGEMHRSCCVPDGVLLGQEHGDLYIVRTFITYEMCSGLQLDVFEENRKHIKTDEGIYNDLKMMLY